MTTAVIVQARMGSTRLPGKVLEDLAGRPVLHHVLSRCKAIAGADVVVCAVPDEPESAALESVAAGCGAVSFRGSEKDVLSRYLGAARAVKADVVMRVTSDCPAIDPQVCADVLRLRERDHADYAANNMPRSFPHGLDCEAFLTKALAEADATTQEPADREHVTPWLRRAPHLRRSNVTSPVVGMAHQRWTLDYPEDLDFFRALFALLPANAIAGWNDIVAILARHPEITAVNAARQLPETV